MFDIAEAASDKAAEKVMAKLKAESVAPTPPPVQIVAAPVQNPVQYIPPQNFVYPMQGASVGAFPGNHQIFPGTMVCMPQGNVMMAGGMHGVDIYGQGVTYGGNTMQSGNMMQGGVMLPMQMNHPHSRDPQYSPCQITDGSELQADGGGGGGFGMAAGRFPHQQSGLFPSGGRS